MRRYDDPIEVRQRGDADSAGAAGSDGDAGHQVPPEAFAWRGRWYQVQAVLGHWYERTPWWRAVLDSSQAGAVLSLASVEQEQEIWRVEAAPLRTGRGGAGGVFDLAKGCRWRLIRMAD